MSSPVNGSPARRPISRRPALLAALAFGVIGFLVACVVLARGLGAAGAERAHVLELLRAQAAGDSGAVLERLPACRRVPACASLTRARVRRLERPGTVQILAFEPSVRLTPSRHTGTARVAWRAADGPPVVQCVSVRREGPLAGASVELLSISDPIAPTASCGAADRAATGLERHFASISRPHGH